MNKRRQTDREWMEWVDKGVDVALSPYERDDVWMVDRPDKGTCMFACMNFGRMDLTAMMREDTYEARLTVTLSRAEMNALRDFLTEKLKGSDLAEAVEAKVAYEDDRAISRLENE